MPASCQLSLYFHPDAAAIRALSDPTHTDRAIGIDSVVYIAFGVRILDGLRPRQLRARQRLGRVSSFLAVDGTVRRFTNPLDPSLKRLEQVSVDLQDRSQTERLYLQREPVRSELA